MQDIQKYEEYCRILGVTSGDSAETVKRAFRSRIKQHHPDTAGATAAGDQAQLLIEAYSVFKKGVPARPAAPRPAPQQQSRRRPGGTTRSGGPHGPDGPARPNPIYESLRRAQEAGYEHGRGGFDSVRKQYRTIFTEPDLNSPLGDVYVNLSGMIWGDDEETYVYGKHSNVREYRPKQKRPEDELFEKAFRRRDGDDFPDHPYDQAVEYFARAEAALRETVRRFDRRSNKFKTSWIRDYIGELARVQVLFRDVSKRYPALSGRALGRVRQISELISEIKNSRSA